MRKANAAVAAVCWLAILPMAAGSESGMFHGEPKIVIRPDELSAARATPARSDAKPAAPSPEAEAESSAQASNPALPRFAIYSPPHRRCVDAGNAAAEASPTMNPDCKAAAQQWVSDKGRLMTAWTNGGGPACMRRVSREADAVELTRCAVADAPAMDQMWVLRGARIVGMDGRCLQTDGQTVQVGTCDPQSSAQIWVMQPQR
jgi:hypothetical protein